MYVVKTFHTDGAASASHDEISLAWAAFAHCVQAGMASGKLLRAELWDTVATIVYDAIRAERCPMAVFDLALVEEKYSSSFRSIELTRRQTNA